MTQNSGTLTTLGVTSAKGSTGGIFVAKRRNNFKPNFNEISVTSKSVENS